MPFPIYSSFQVMSFAISTGECRIVPFELAHFPSHVTTKTMYKKVRQG